MRKIFLLAACACLLFTGAAVNADELTEMKRQLEQQRKMIEKMEKRIEELEAKAKKEAASKTVAVKTEKHADDQETDLSWLKSIEWIKRIKWSGDIRYRHEYIDNETQATNHRNRNRIRARLKIEGEVNDEVDATLRLASGSSDSPTSTNQTLDDSFSSKPIWLDLAYADYHPNFVPGLHVFAGKMDNPFYKAGRQEVFWDNDVTPEGGAVTYAHGFFDDLTTIHVNAGGFWLEERNAGPSVDTSLWGVQAYVVQKLPADMHVIGGATYYDFGNIKDRSITIAFSGNSNMGGNYIYDYDVLEVFGEFGIKLAGFPITLYGAYFDNTAIGNDVDSAWITGIMLGKAKEPGSFQFTYDYREVESDAVVGGLNDATFAAGLTDSKGHKIGIAYQLMKNWQIALTYFHNDMNWHTTKDELNLLQADLIFKF